MWVDHALAVFLSLLHTAWCSPSCSVQCVCVHFLVCAATVWLSHRSRNVQLLSQHGGIIGLQNAKNKNTKHTWQQGMATLCDRCRVPGNHHTSCSNLVGNFRGHTSRHQHNQYAKPIEDHVKFQVWSLMINGGAAGRCTEKNNQHIAGSYLDPKESVDVARRSWDDTLEQDP